MDCENLAPLFNFVSFDNNFLFDKLVGNPNSFRNNGLSFSEILYALLSFSNQTYPLSIKYCASLRDDLILIDKSPASVYL